MQRHFVYVS